MGSNRDWGVDRQFLVAPPFAGPDDPQIVIGSEMPAELIAYYGTIYAGILSRTSATSYIYRILYDATNDPTEAVGVVIGGVVREYSILYGTPNPILRMGFSDPSTTWFDTQAAILIDGTFNFTGALPAVFAGAGITISSFAPFAIDGVSQGRGLIDLKQLTVASGAIGAEAVIITGNSKTYKANRAYQVEWGGRLQSSAANVRTLRVKKTNAVGQLLNVWQETVVAGALDADRTHLCYFTVGGADVTAVIVLTAAASAGTVTQLAGATSSRNQRISDVGNSGLYPTAPVLV